MNNHYHLVIETPDGNLSKGMRQLNGVYTQSFNRKHNKVGHLFQGRYKAILVCKESHLLEVCRYVVLNPVRTKTTKTPLEWKWSSYCATAGFEKPHPCLTVDWVLGQFSTKRWIARKKYQEFVKAGIQKSSIWTSVKGQIILGNKDFVEKFIDYVRKRKKIKEIPRGQRYLSRPSLAKLFNSKTKKDKQIRNKKIREAVKNYGYSQNEVAKYLGMHYSTISRLLKEETSKVKTNLPNFF